ncbi:MAG: hypothetical protein J1F33_08295 [Clostridiales bacterium]|nr:hypothetical protein [Clostridiales bacterium]
MKQLTYDGYVVYEFENEKIYKNFGMIRGLCFLSLSLGVVTVILFSALQTEFKLWAEDFTMTYLLLYLNLIIPPIGNIVVCTYSAKRPSELSRSELSKVGRYLYGFYNNHAPSTSHFPAAAYICQYLMFFSIDLLLIIVCALSGNGGYGAYLVGYMSSAQVPLYIGLGFLITNCVLMNREWNGITPPVSVALPQDTKTSAQASEPDEEEYSDREEAVRREQKQQLAETAKQIKLLEKTKKLLNTCGIRFFIKYCTQIRRLPIRDITVEENYPPEEKKERLLAAKEITNSDLTKTALKYIVDEYSDILDETEVERAVTLLSEIENNTSKN